MSSTAHNVLDMTLATTARPVGVAGFRDQSQRHRHDVSAVRFVMFLSGGVMAQRVSSEAFRVRLRFTRSRLRRRSNSTKVPFIQTS
ncbi:hypothetical protein AWB68_07357 [Caballeronia choica]|uniref:Uncharacterized protein n=1 Tax=Caballeronia choica TaxID=326476 RepID=A0A158KV21_9BURK|nr:hypothetical protein AWB68_07357 [Caballeronia choica]